MDLETMRTHLERISAVVGVKGSFVFDPGGRVLAMALSVPPGSVTRPGVRGVPALIGMTPSEPEAPGPSLEGSSVRVSAAALSTLARTATQTLGGLRSVARRRPVSIDLVYADGRLLIKSLAGGCLCVWCAPRVNLPLVRLTVDSTAPRLSAQLRERLVVTAPAAHAVAPAQSRAGNQPSKSADRLSSFLRPFSR